jgi:hypothetical protein
MKIDRLEAVAKNSTFLKIIGRENLESGGMNERELFARILTFLFKHKEIRFNREDIKAMTSPCVYVFFRGNDALYVGMSRLGIQRMFTQKENVSCEDLFRDADEAMIIPLDTEEEARDAEKYLIRQLLPVYNRV